MVSALIATAFAQDDAEAVKAQWLKVSDQLRLETAKLSALMDEAEIDVLPTCASPRKTGPKSTPPTRLERLNGEIKRRTDVAGIFANGDAIVRLIGAILPGQNDERTGRSALPLHDPWKP